MKRFEGGTLGDWGAVEVSTYTSIDRATIAESAQVLACFTGGAAAIVENTYGRGRVIFVATSADADWSTLPTNVVYFTFVNEALRHLGAGSEGAGETLVGDVPTIRMRDAMIGAAVSVEGPMDREPRPIGEVVSPALPGFDAERPANYRILLEKGMVVRELWTSVNIDPTETDTRKASQMMVESLRPNTVVSTGATVEGIYKRVGTRRSGLDLTALCVLLSAALLVAESFLSNRFYRT